MTEEARSLRPNRPPPGASWCGFGAVTGVGDDRAPQQSSRTQDLCLCECRKRCTHKEMDAGELTAEMEPDGGQMSLDQM